MRTSRKMRWKTSQGTMSLRLRLIPLSTKRMLVRKPVKLAVRDPIRAE